MKNQSEIDLQRMVDEGGNASLPEIEVSNNPDFKLVTFSASSIIAIEIALRSAITETNIPQFRTELNKALKELLNK